MSSIGGIGGGGGGIQSILAMRQQIIERSNLLQQVKAPAAPEAPTSGPVDSFTSVLKNALDSVNATQNKSEAITDAYQRGEVTDVASVMLARQEASVAFEATLQTRNRLLSAYQDIMRMGV